MSNKNRDTKPLEGETVEQYRKKQVVIKAIQWTGKNTDTILQWCQGDATYEAMTSGRNCLVIQTLESDTDAKTRRAAQIDDWIIQGVKGEFYPCKPDIFAMTYEANWQKEQYTERVEGKGDDIINMVRCFIRTHHLTAKWDGFIETYPNSTEIINSLTTPSTSSLEELAEKFSKDRLGDPLDTWSDDKKEWFQRQHENVQDIFKSAYNLNTERDKEHVSAVELVEGMAKEYAAEIDLDMLSPKGIANNEIRIKLLKSILTRFNPHLKGKE